MEKTEQQLRKDWEMYQKMSHPDDQMSYVEFLSSQGIEINENEFN